MEVKLKTTSAFIKHQKCKKKILISQGGARSGKTYSILQLLFLTAITNKNLVISVVAENMPFIKRGALRDFKDILNQTGLNEVVTYNKTNSIFTFTHTGSIIEFFSVENYGKAVGSARDILFVNECNNIFYEIVFQLMARTRGRIYLDYNPTHEFWVHEEIIDNPEYTDVYDFILTTFKDNEELSEEIVKLMLARAAKDPNYRRVYVEGELGSVEGLIFPSFTMIDTIPQEVKEKARKQWIGLDWGYSNDPASINEVWVIGDIKQPVKEAYLNEITYDTGLSNKNLTDIIKRVVETTNYEVIADNSEPKSIDELSTNGIRIRGVEKPQGSVNFGIELLQQADIYITKNSINTIKEFRNYKWAVDKNGKTERDSKGRPVPIDLWNHSIDNLRYVVFTKHSEKFEYKRNPRGRKRRVGVV